MQQYFCRTCNRKFAGKDTLENKHTPTPEIGTALGMFYNGLYLSKISQQIQAIYNDDIGPSTIYYWVKEYSCKAIDIFKRCSLNVGDIWVVDETVINICGQNVWFWDIIDEKTRFLLASHLSKERTIADVAVVMRKALDRTGREPKYILSDSLKAYPKGIQRIFGDRAKHVKSKGFTAEINTNLIERFHGTVKERTKILRGFKSLETAKMILDGFLINYNFFRPHMSLKDTTPAHEAGVKLPFDTWEGLLRILQYGS